MPGFVGGIRVWAQASPTHEFWIVAGILIAAAIAGFIFSFHYLHKKRIFEDTPTSKIRSAAQGYIELDGHGRLMEGPPIVAPLTGQYCTWYRYFIEEHQGSGKNSKWVTIAKGVSEELFLLTDETGKCVIDPDGATVIHAIRDRWYGSDPRPRGGPATGRKWFFSGRYRYTETRLHPGEPLLAIGLYKTIGGASAELNVNAEVVALLKEWKADSNSMLNQFDLNRDGQIDMHEWEKVRAAALQHVLEQHKEIRTVPAVNVLGQTHDTRRPFILSAIPQETLVSRYNHHAAMLIGLFFVAGSVACWLISLRY